MRFTKFHYRNQRAASVTVVKSSIKYDGNLSNGKLHFFNLFLVYCNYHVCHVIEVIINTLSCRHVTFIRIGNLDINTNADMGHCWNIKEFVPLAPSNAAT